MDGFAPFDDANPSDATRPNHASGERAAPRVRQRRTAAVASSGRAGATPRPARHSYAAPDARAEGALPTRDEHWQRPAHLVLEHGVRTFRLLEGRSEADLRWVTKGPDLSGFVHTRSTGAPPNPRW